MHPDLLHPDRLSPGSWPARQRTPAADRRPDAGSPLPARWVREGGLRAFRADAGHVGRAIAALKLSLTLVVSQDERSVPGGPIVLSYGRIAALSGLSDPLICSGKKALLDQGLVTTSAERQGRTIVYRLCGPQAATDLALLPHGPRGAERIAALHALTCRKAPNLAVLKLGLLLGASADETASRPSTSTMPPLSPA